MSIESILLVEIEPELRSVICEAVRRLDFHAQTSAGGQEALELIRQRPYDVIIANISMPEVDGLKLMQAAREALGDKVLIILTGYSNEYDYERIIGAGANEFIRKPYTLREMEAKLGRIFRERLLQDENRLLLQEQKNLTAKLARLLAVAGDLSSELDFDRLFPLIIHKVTEAMEAERSSLYIIDWEREEIWTKVAEQVKEIRLPLGQGISGRVAETGEALNIYDAWELPYFNREFDRKHNFRTRAVLCIPINNRSGERFAVMQVINKREGGGFNSEDEALLKGLAAQVAIALENSFLIEELSVSFESSIRTLSATVDAKHPLTAGHSQRVTDYALLIGRQMNQDQEQQKVLKYAALLHDIGKIGIADQVLLKDGPFTPAERAEMNTHPLKTRSILEKFHFPKDLHQVPSVAAYHHERMDGKGYPEGITAQQIPLGSKILAVADVFDALTSRRDYPKYSGTQKLSRDPMPLIKVVSILKDGVGSQFDPILVDAFLKILPEALEKNRGTHFSPDYVDDMIKSS